MTSIAATGRIWAGQVDQFVSLHPDLLVIFPAGETDAAVRRGQTDRRIQTQTGAAVRQTPRCGTQTDTDRHRQT